MLTLKALANTELLHEASAFHGLPKTMENARVSALKAFHARVDGYVQSLGGKVAPAIEQAMEELSSVLIGALEKDFPSLCTSETRGQLESAFAYAGETESEKIEFEVDTLRERLVADADATLRRGGQVYLLPYKMILTPSFFLSLLFLFLSNLWIVNPIITASF